MMRHFTKLMRRLLKGSLIRPLYVPISLVFTRPKATLASTEVFRSLSSVSATDLFLLLFIATRL